ncbi:MAG: hypothetical protein KGI02_08350 [Thaumarchaeota archaeon]|nr:hypothetical protein [Nitrososphaerota archaeon]MDE1840433.1 hypothetical protein [Nitrososphaerota archaeon]MDE1878151.1 hypothetical protein [Nitrososphaerota archaeon]
MANHDHKIKQIVLKNEMSQDEANRIIDQQKSRLFSRLLKRTDKDEIIVDSLNLVYESYLILSGKYAADFYCTTKHAINVDPTVKEVVIADGIFPVRTEDRMLDRIQVKMNPLHKNQVDIDLEEHRHIENEAKIAVDHRGNATDFSYRIDSRTVESYPQHILDNNKNIITRPQIDYNDIIGKLVSKLKEILPTNKIRNLEESISKDDILEVYVPRYEARLTGPKNEIKVLRVDAITKKIL